MTTDPILADIMAAIAVLQGGDRADGKAKLEAIWSRIADNPQPFHECTLAHYLADAQDNLAEDYFKLGDKDRSRRHIASAREAVSHLADDGYGRMIRGGIERLAQRLGPTD